MDASTVWQFKARIPARKASRSAARLLVFLAGLVALLSTSPSTAQSVAPGDFVVNEVLADPAIGLPGDANGDGVRDSYDDEFVEIVNVSVSELDLSGLTLEDSTAVRHTFPAPTVVPPGCAVIVFGGGAPSGVFGGAITQTASTGTLSLTNSSDIVHLMNGTTEISTFAYGGPSCAGDQDQSVTLEPDLTGTCQTHGTIPGSEGALFSPGTRVDGVYFGDCGLLIFADGFENGTTSEWSQTNPAILR